MRCSKRIKQSWRRGSARLVSPQHWKIGPQNCLMGIDCQKSMNGSHSACLNKMFRREGISAEKTSVTYPLETCTGHWTKTKRNGVLEDRLFCSLQTFMTGTLNEPAMQPWRAHQMLTSLFSEPSLLFKDVHLTQRKHLPVSNNSIQWRE